MAIWLCAPARAAADVMSGDGWLYDDNSRTLSITGEYVWAERGPGGGPAKNPWYEFREEIKKVTLSRDVTSIGDDAFVDCDGVSVDYGEAQVRTIGKCAFMNSGFIDYIFPCGDSSASLTSIGDSAFWLCEVDWSNYWLHDKYEVKALAPPTLGENAFFNFYGLLIVPGASLAEYKASDWANVSTTIYPDHISGEGWSVDYHFWGYSVTITSDYVWAERGAGGEPAKNAWSESLNVIDIVDLGSGVTSIGDDAFANCQITSVGNFYQVKTIGKCAFKNTQALNVIPFYWPASLTSIGDSAFYGCGTPSNQEFISQTLVPPTLGKDVFNFNSSDGVTLFVPGESLAAYKASEWAKYFVIVPENIDGDGWSLDANRLTITADYVWAVRDNDTPARNPWYEFRERIEDVYFDDDVTSIGDDAFAGFTKLRSVKYPGEIKTIGKCAFKDCGVQCNIIPYSEYLTSIGDSAFWGIEFSEKIDFVPNRNAPPSLGKGVFSMTPDYGIQLIAPAESLEAYEASDWIKYFKFVPETISGDGWSFSLSSRYLTIAGDYVWPVSDSGTPARNAWYEYERKIWGIFLEDGVTSIGDYAFADCENMDFIAYGNAQIKTIGKCAFKGRGIDWVFPENCATLTSIGDYAFLGPNPRCTTFRLKAVVPPTLGKDVFSFAASDSITLLVPSGSVAAYEASDWAKYFVIEADYLTAMDAVPVKPESRPKVVNGVVTFGGEPAREVYSLSGRRMPAGVPLARGIYVVATPAGAVRVAVK